MELGKAMQRWKKISRRLKPCPLCGGPAYYMETIGAGVLLGRSIRCYECNLAIYGKKQKKLIERWNRREGK